MSSTVRAPQLAGPFGETGEAGTASKATTCSRSTWVAMSYRAASGFFAMPSTAERRPTMIRSGWRMSSVAPVVKIRRNGWNGCRRARSWSWSPDIGRSPPRFLGDWRRSPIEPRQSSGAVAVSIDCNAHAVEHREVQVVERLLIVFQVPAGLDRAAAPAGQEDGQVVVVVAVAVADPAAVNDHDMVQQGSAGLAGRRELPQQVGDLLDVETVDGLDLLVLGLVAAVVREVVMSIRDVEERVAAVAGLVGKHEGRDPGEVSLVGQRQEIEHQPDVFPQVLGDAAGSCHPGVGPGFRGGFRRGDPQLDLPDRAEILIDLAAVVPAQAIAELPGVLQDEIEHAPLVPLLLEPLGRRVAAGSRTEQAVEDQPGVDLLGHRHAGRLPGDVGRVGAAIARIAATRLGGGIDPQLEGGESRVPAEFPRRDLVDGGPRAEVGAVGLERVDA